MLDLDAGKGDRRRYRCIRGGGIGCYRGCADMVKR